MTDDEAAKAAAGPVPSSQRKKRREQREDCTVLLLLTPVTTIVACAVRVCDDGAWREADVKKVEKAMPEKGDNGGKLMSNGR